MKNYVTEIKLENPELLVPHPRNTNRHSVEQIEHIAKCIDHLGIRSPIIVSTRCGKITKGHATRLALMKLGLQAPVSYQHYDSEIQEIEHITSDNELARYAQTDWQELHCSLDELSYKGDTELLGLKNFSMEQEEEEKPKAAKTEKKCPHCGENL